jgi:hypothetical protein
MWRWEYERECRKFRVCERERERERKREREREKEKNNEAAKHMHPNSVFKPVPTWSAKARPSSACCAARTSTKAYLKSAAAQFPTLHACQNAESGSYRKRFPALSGGGTASRPAAT